MAGARHKTDECSGIQDMPSACGPSVKSLSNRGRATEHSRQDAPSEFRRTEWRPPKAGQPLDFN